MTNRSRWLLIITLGVMLHLFLTNNAVGYLGYFRNQPGITAMLLPFGQVNYSTATSIAAIEWLILFGLWIFLAYSLLREKSD